MSARANMAAASLLLVNLLVGWSGVLAAAEAGPRCGCPEAEPPEQVHRVQVTEAEAMLERASAWLWGQRDREAGWGNDTHLALLALRLANLSREDNVPPPASLEMQLNTKRMELEIVLLLWRHREMESSPVRLALYSLALSAMCMDPRQFHGHDLIGSVQHHEPPSEYEFALGALAACNAQAHVRKRQMRRLLDIAHEALEHDVETVAMGLMTLRCIVQDHRHRNLQHFVRKPSVSLAQRQRRDGSFGDVRATALAMQALEEVENEPLDNWNRSAAVGWLAARQAPDGSFAGDLRITAEVVLGLAPRGLPTIRALDCGQGMTDSPPPRLPPPNSRASATSRAGTAAPVPPTAPSAAPPGSSSTTSAAPATTSAARTPAPSSTVAPRSVEQRVVAAVAARPPVNVTYTLWVGSDVDQIYNLTVSAPKNESFYEVMVLAAQRSPNFQFSAYEWPNGHYVHTLAGYKEQPMIYYYWLLYRLPSPPEPSSPPGNQFVAPGGVDNLLISDGEHYLFWYKKL